MSTDILSITEVTVGLLGGVGVLALGLGYIYSQFSKGKNGQTKEQLETENSLTTYLKNQVSGFKEIIDNQNVKITELGKEMAGLRATLDEKDKTIDKYLAILQNRNPELENFISSMTKNAAQYDTFMKDSAAFQGELMGVMKGLTSFMEKINTHMEQDLTIKSTITHA